MKVLISGRHVPITAALRAYVEEKAVRFERYFGRLIKADVVLDVQGDHHQAEIVVQAPPRARFVGKARAGDMYAAIDEACDRLARQVKRHVDRLHDHRARGGAVAGAGAREAEDAEETYDDAVRRFRDRDDGRSGRPGTDRKGTR